MLNNLKDAEGVLPDLLATESIWNSVFVDYHPPSVERLRYQWGPYRIYLHRIHPCLQGEALFHPHPWPSAMKILSGKYEMAIGFGGGEISPPIASTIIIGEGTTYEMTHPDSWHFVRPLDEPSMSLMITGQPWNRPSPGTGTKLGSLSDGQKTRMFEFFRRAYPKT